MKTKIFNKTPGELLQEIYESEINFYIETFWDGGMDVRLGDSLNGFKEIETFDTFNEAVEFLVDSVIKHFPHSDFVKNNVF